ncbi:type IV secretion system protein B4, putative [Vibrio mediterranei AK1]|uniref:VirB4 family type IV secretion system protein n=1 Tax=Vibrio mediterranei TaxID=689 RepID=UPI0001542D80|nr:hypothetical protein [Vibrio mediterranei]EDL52201.1 type IV secretion system protein B4, putative [Vibrio mediterranei AK1]
MDALNTAIATYAPISANAALTYRGGILGAIELSGVEPALLNDSEKESITFLLRNAIQRLPFSVTLSQYYFHSECPPIRFKERDNPRAKLVSNRRASYLNQQRDLYQSRLFWVIEIHGITNYTEIGKDFISMCLKSLVDKDYRNKLKTALSHKQSVLLEEQELNEQIDILDETLSSLSLSLSFRSLDNERLSSSRLFHLQKSLVTMEPYYLDKPPKEAPIQDWDTLLSSGDVEPILIDGIHYLKITNDRPIYLRIAAIKGVGMSHTPECAWASEFRPVLEKGNYLFFTRFEPYEKDRKNAMVKEQEGDLYRSQTRITDFIKGEADSASIQARIEASPKLRETMREIERISNDTDKYGDWVGYVVLFDSDISKIKSRTKGMKSVLENSDFHLLWESVGLLNAYKTLLLGHDGELIRRSQINATQAAALSLFFRSHEGFPRFQLGDRKEEALFVFESDDGVPFYYTPFIGDKCLVIGVGPTRSGKTFLKQCVANHFLKLGGMYCTMDIDAGSEPLAHFFQDDAALFCLKDTQTSKGFNPFSMSFGKGDDGFVRHMMELIRMMLEMNEARENQELNASEQKAVTEAIIHTMQQEGKLRSFSAMLGKCPPSLNQKLANFKRGGIHGNLFDNDVDAIGALDKPYSVYNTEGVKDAPKLAALVNSEIFFRSVRLFENPRYRTTPKFFEIDECQYVLSQRGAAEFAIAKARTWFKHGGGMGFWTQSPKHYSDLSEWGTLMSAATTFIFMADAEMKREDYITAFPFLTDAELNVIQSLKPKQQAFIKQPDKGIAKVINLHVEPEQYVIATSRPHEAALAKRILEAEEDVDIAVDKIVEELGLNTKESR